VLEVVVEFEVVLEVAPAPPAPPEPEVPPSSPHATTSEEDRPRIASESEPSFMGDSEGERNATRECRRNDRSRANRQPAAGNMGTIAARIRGLQAHG